MVVIAVHGGAGLIKCSNDNPPDFEDCKVTLRDALTAGYDILDRGGSAVDAILKSIEILEDFPGFNAGKGAVFNRDGFIELDAGIMDGFTGMAAGVTGCTTIKNPIRLAHDVMLRTPHCLIAGPHADKLGQLWGHTVVDPSYFRTERRWNQLQTTLAKLNAPSLDHGSDVKGTVGAVALDRNGNLASGSSTGGLTGKFAGRVSDSSIAGAGFYADRCVAVSGTGNGDYFIKRQTCVSVASLIEQNQSITLDDACRKVIFEKMYGAEAGMIAVSSKGDVTMPFNTGGMFRGYKNANEMIVKVFE